MFVKMIPPVRPLHTVGIWDLVTGPSVGHHGQSFNVTAAWYQLYTTMAYWQSVWGMIASSQTWNYLSTIVLGTIYWPFFCKNPSQLQGTHTAETLAGGFLVIWSKAHIFLGGTSFRNGSLLFNLQYLGQIFIKSNNQGQFRNPQDELISKLSLLARFDKDLAEILEVEEKASISEWYRFFLSSGVFS